jgi:cytochrome c553
MTGLTRAFALNLVCAAVVALTPGFLHASGNAEAGREKAQVCQTCHGLDGKSVDPSYPNLAGQYESYLVKALADYRSGNRNNAIMQSFAVNLSNQDIEDLAAWYASQEGLRDLSIK